jgi:putative transposase
MLPSGCNDLGSEAPMPTEYFNPNRRVCLRVRKSASCAHKLDYHFVFATKYRRPVLAGAIAEAIRDWMGALCEERGWILLALSIMPDHVHALVGLPPSEPPTHVAHDFKGLTSYRAMGAFPELKDVLASSSLWGRGYSVETLGKANVEQISGYLHGQEAHHAEQHIDYG